MDAVNGISDSKSTHFSFYDIFARAEEEKKEQMTVFRPYQLYTLTKLRIQLGSRFIG
jgi:hypothetical protein